MIRAKRASGLPRPLRVWLFDLDNTLHDASHSAFTHINEAMTSYIVEHLALSREEASRLRTHYWHRYGATLLGLIKHHGVQASHFLEQTHQLQGLESRLRMSAADRAALRLLPGRKFILTNAPRSYAVRVLSGLGLLRLFDGVICVEDMTMFGHMRPKPDARMFRHLAARLGTPPSRCVLVEDTLVHQREARRCGLQTAWMQRYLRPLTAAGKALSAQPLPTPSCRKPVYVSARVKHVRGLRVFCNEAMSPTGAV